MKKILLLILACWFFEVSGSVVAIHGFLVNDTTMLPICRCLRKSGFRVCRFSYESRKDTIECHGRHLVEFLKRLACECPGEPIHFVTHSVGGVVLRSAIAQPDCPQEAKIGRAVLLAPPNQGSMLARNVRDVAPIRFAMGTKSGMQLMCYTPAEMAAFGCFPPSMQILILAGCRGTHIGFDGRANDGFLAIEETRLNTPHAFVVLQLNHGQLLKNREALRLTRDFIVCGSLPPCTY